MLAGRRYAFSFIDSGTGYRSDLSQPTGSTGPTGASSEIVISGLPTTVDPRIDGIEIWGAEDGQGGGGAVATWHGIDTVAITDTKWTDTTAETALEALAVWPGAVQPVATGDIFFTVTRNGAPWLQFHIEPGASKSNVISGMALFSVQPGTLLNADIVNTTTSTPPLQAVLE